ncbi:MAG TPA: type II secretion system protein [Methylomirabilota bacterium]|nr:type II secretion system protein [Methylomirabilota bacterium]
MMNTTLTARNGDEPAGNGGGARAAHGMTLIGLIGVMAVLAILGAVLVPAFIRMMDRIAGDRESASLKALADSLESSILRNRYIPSHTNWAQVVATERGVNLTDVTTNLRRQPRVFLIDPALQIGSRVAGEDFLQDTIGSVIFDSDGRVIPPIKPRMILLSSIGVSLPAGVTTGVPASTDDFDGIWNSVDGELPAGSLWSGWSGASDLRVQRVNLSPLFAHVVLTTYASDGDGLFSIDSGSTTNAPENSIGWDTYFIQNSVLNLLSWTNTLDTQHIVTRDISFVYQQNIWRASIGGLGFAGGMDIGAVVDRFLRAPNNPEAVDPANQQFDVVQSFSDYMKAYQDWEASGFTDNTLLGIAEDAQVAMMAAVQGLYKSPNNEPPEVPCP